MSSFCVARSFDLFWKEENVCREDDGPFLRVIKLVQSKDYTISSLKWASHALNKMSSLYCLASFIISIISVEEEASAAA